MREKVCCMLQVLKITKIILSHAGFTESKSVWAVLRHCGRFLHTVDSAHKLLICKTKARLMFGATLCRET